jgi:hypothetical protein
MQLNDKSLEFGYVTGGLKMEAATVCNVEKRRLHNTKLLLVRSLQVAARPGKFLRIHA